MTKSMKRRKGIVGIEAAIVLIAFVIVAAALSFVALNMGLFTTQKSKEVINRGLEESTSALEVDGSVIGVSNGNNVTAMAIPIKLAPGREAVDLSPNKTTVSLLAGSHAFENVLKKVYYVTGSSGNYTLWNPLNSSDVITNITDLSIDTLVKKIWPQSPSSPEAVFIILKNVNPDSVLQYGEKALLLANFGESYALLPYQKAVIEVKPPEGAILTLDRSIPATLPSGGGDIDLG